MLLTSVLLAKVNHVEDVHPNRPLSTFPKQIGNWVGKEQRFDQRIYEKLGVDESFLANYRDSNNREINLYIGFYQSQREGELIHSPKHCMPGSGWIISKRSLEKLEVPSIDNNRIKVVMLVQQKGAEKNLVLYWYHSRGRILHSEYWQKIYLVLDSIFRRRTDGSFVRLISQVKNENEEEALNVLRDFAETIFPIINEHIPS